jgi:hypothetical protein
MSRTAIGTTVLVLLALWLASCGKSGTIPIQSPPLSYFNIVHALNGGFSYAYAPSIIVKDGTYHVFFCSMALLLPTWDAIRMSACCGATSGIRKAFENKPKKPEIIFGSSDERSYGEYAVAWAILYHRFKKDGIDKDSAQRALKDIHAVVSDKFLYRRWSNSHNEYRSYPGKGRKYEITATNAARHPPD